MTNRTTNGSARALLLGGIGALLGAAALLAQIGASVPNWTVPPYSARPGGSGLTTMGDVSDGSVFVALDLAGSSTREIRPARTALRLSTRLNANPFRDLNRPRLLNVR